MAMDAMAPRIGDGPPAGLSTVVLLLVIAVLFGALGRWQLTRAAEQSNLERQVTTAGNWPVLDLREAEASESDAYRHAVAEGVYDPNQQFYLEGREYRGVRGYHVVTALRLVGTRRYVLINRGWLAASVGRATVPAGRLQVRGRLVPAALPALRLGEPTGATRPFLDPRDYARESGRLVEPLMLLAETDEAGLAPVRLERTSKQGMHQGYAVQWFAFAAIAMVVAAMIVVQRTRRVP